MTINYISKFVNDWLKKPFSQREKLWISRLQILKKSQAKFVLALAFFAGAWWYEGSWLIAFTLVVAVYGHELGHLWAMRSVGMETLGTWFIPFFGGVAVSADNSEANNWERWLVAVMGPLWGFIMALIPFIIYQYLLEDKLQIRFFDSQLTDTMRADRTQTASFAIGWVKVVRDIALINFVNLLPLPFLDGGRMIEEMILSFSRKTATILLLIFFGLAGLILLKSQSVWLAVLSGLSVIELWSRWRKKELNGEMCGAEVLIAILFYFSLLICLFLIFQEMQDEIRHWKWTLQYSR